MKHPNLVDLTGQQFGTLTVVERDHTTGRDVSWFCACDCGNRVRVFGTNLKRGLTKSCGCSRRGGNPQLTYGGAHALVRRVRGRAPSHPCIDCGGQARHWSYAFTDPDPLVDPKGREYSVDPSHYEARCVPCHKRFDLDHASGRSPAAESVTHQRKESLT